MTHVIMLHVQDKAHGNSSNGDMSL